MTRRPRRNVKSLMLPILGVMSFITVIILMVYLPDIYPSEDWPTIRSNFILLTPWLLMTGIGIFFFAFILKNKPANGYVYTTPTGALIGIGGAMMVRALDDMGVIIDEVIRIHTSISVTDLQLIAFVAWTMAGLVLGILRER